MALDIRRGQDGKVILTGRFDASQVDKVQAFLDLHVRTPATVDCKDLHYISSAGLGVLLRTQKRLTESGEGLKIINLNHHIREIFRFSGFDQVFEVEGAPEE